MRADWVEVELGDVAEIISGKNQKDVIDENGKYPIYGSAGICGYATDYLCEAGTTIIGRKGTINKPIFTKEKFWNIDTAFGIWTGGEIDKKYLYYFCCGFDFNKLDKSTTIPSLAKRDLLKIQFPVCPLPEQRAIVAKIDELFSDLDNGIANLKAAQAKLDIYRQAVLKQAFEGELTREWREKQTDLPSSEKLFETIQNEHKILIKNSKFKLLSTEETNELPNLPSSWLWIRYENLCSKVKNGISATPDGNESDIKILRISAVRAFNVDLNDCRFIKNNGGFDGFFLEYGDLLFTRYNGSKKYVGVCGCYKSKELCLFPDKIIQTKVGLKNISPFYLEYAINSTVPRKFIEGKIKTTAGQSGIAGSDIKAIPVPICSLKEQNQIVQEIEARLSVCDKLAETIQTSLQQAEALRQSILKKAFEGRLLTETELQTCKAQADWMPAEQLLAQIKSTNAK